MLGSVFAFKVCTQIIDRKKLERSHLLGQTATAALVPFSEIGRVEFDALKRVGLTPPERRERLVDVAVVRATRNLLQQHAFGGGERYRSSQPACLDA